MKKSKKLRRKKEPLGNISKVFVQKTEQEQINLYSYSSKINIYFRILSFVVQ